jgi:outer membrane protein OmpA-like peptidoglycan-associated protein
MKYKKITILFFIIAISSCNKQLYNIDREHNTILVTHADKSEKSSDVKLSRREISNNAISHEIDTYAGGYLYEAVRDEKSGEMISVKQLDEITISSRSYNISERNGSISLGFVVTIPASLMNSRWQIVLLPILSRGDDTLHFSKIVVKGEDFKRAQEKSYCRYEKYLHKIIPDDADFYTFYTDLPNLIIFLERNLPKSRIFEGHFNEELQSEFGISEKKIIDHYVKNWLIEKNEKRKREKDLYFNKYVKNQKIKNCKLDSVIKSSNGDFAFHYTQEILANEQSSKLYLNLYSTISDISGFSINIKPSDTLIYNVSSMVSLLDTSKKYTKKIVFRKVSTTKSLSITFKSGEYKLDPNLSGNLDQLQMIKQYLDNNNSNELKLDSLIITATASPEGSYKSNKILSANRAASVVKYFNDILKDVKIISRSIPEEWSKLSLLIQNDSNIIERPKIMECFKIDDPDKRELAMMLLKKDYNHIKEEFYPLLRKVDFTFYHHKINMIKDTIHTTEIDSNYMNGIKLLKERKYQDAVKILTAYDDVNTAIAYMSLGNNATAEKILAKLPKSAKTIYLMSILASRNNQEEKAVKYFLKAKQMDISIAYRGTLDPEISYLIRKYNLNDDLFK